MTRPTKVHTTDSGSFNKTLKHVVLMCSNVIGNNNKFYSLEIQTNGSECRLFSHYGRIMGDTIDKGVMELREGYHNESSAERDFDSIVSKKKKGKTVKRDGQAYRESYSEIDFTSSSVGSTNVRNAKTVTTKNSIDKNLFESYGKKEAILLKMLEEENIHNITSTTTMKYQDGGLQTPLGPLTENHLKKARSVLDKIAAKVSKVKDGSPAKVKLTDALKNLNNDYLSLIPRNFGNVIDESSMIISGSSVTNEYDLINQMETAIKMMVLKDDDNDEETKAKDLGFHFKIASKKVKDEVTEHVERTRNNSSHRNLSGYKVHQVYEVENFKERMAYEEYADKLKSQKPAGRQSHKFDFNEIDLFHGSRNSNILSILMNGFYVPPQSAGHVTGRMFGDGVYGADQSTKALNYSAGYWGGKSNKNDSIFCFVARFAMGKVKTTKRSLYNGAPDGYDSIFAEGGADLRNNEYIVPNTKQTSISYLIEFKNK